MKTILFASLLALSTAAIAQDTTPAPATPPADPAAAAPATPDASTPPAAPDAAAPAAAPADASAAPASAASTDDSNLPVCSKTVTDKCKQGGKGAGHHAKHHKK